MSWRLWLLRAEIAREFYRLQPNMGEALERALFYRATRHQRFYEAHRVEELRRTSLSAKQRRADPETREHMNRKQWARAAKWYEAMRLDPEKFHKYRERQRRTRAKARERHSDAR